MAKRFTATEKWIDPWFCSLPPAHKLFWLFILDNCDHSGIWQVNWPLVKFMLGTDYQFDKSLFGDRIQELGVDKWFIPKFIDFQYGTLKSDCKAHLSVISRLEKERVSIPIGYSIQGVQDKDKDKDKDKVVEDRVQGKGTRFIPPTLDEVAAYCSDRNNTIDPQAFIDYYTVRGWVPNNSRHQMKNWKSAVHTWEKNQSKQGANDGRVKAQPGKYANIPTVKG